MKINQIIVNESMGGVTSGAIATVESPLGGTQKRTQVAGLKPVDKIAKAKKKGPYANSLVEGKMKDLDYDMKTMKPAEFQKKYGKKREEMQAAMSAPKPQTPQQKPVQEAKLDEDDIIVVPGQKMKRKTGFVQHGQSRVDHEVEMARSDVLATMKNAKAIYKLLQNKTEEDGIEGWVQEKLIKANDYLNAVKEYYDEKMMQEAGVIAGGGVGEAYDPTTGRFFRPDSQELRKQRRAEKEAGKPTTPTNPPSPVKKKPLTPFGPGQQKVNEKFASQQQAKFMYATAGGADTGVSKKVAKEFIKKSHGQKVKDLPKKVKKD